MIQPASSFDDSHLPSLGAAERVMMVEDEVFKQGFESNKDTLSLEQLYQRLNTTPEQVARFSEKWQIIELALFGSILREDFRVNGDRPSDVDVLFTYGETARKNLILQVRMKFELEELLHRNVDLVSKTAILDDPNGIRREQILGSARVIYAAR